ncbi:hypothetical protein FBU30_006378 [Linnemannia zychae]|nr:hypothetical protein FBU30_006378 [Linnemannia zychae]
MVSFVCDTCQETIKKPKLDQHFNRCPYAQFSCIDCSVSFQGTEYRSHTSCISEAEKYQKALYRGPKKGGHQNNGKNQNTNNNNKGAQKETKAPTPAPAPAPETKAEKAPTASSDVPTSIVEEMKSKKRKAEEPAKEEKASKKEKKDKKDKSEKKEQQEKKEKK